MSYDIDIFTPEIPEQRSLEAFLAQHPEVTAEGRIDHAPGHAFLSAKPTGGGPGFTLDVEEPDPEEIEFKLPSQHADLKYILRISMPAARTEIDWNCAWALARTLAEQCRGVVYDPQDGRVG